jgi:hypothetical protein
MVVYHCFSIPSFVIFASFFERLEKAYEMFLFLLLIPTYFIVGIVWEAHQISSRLALRFSIRGIKILIIFFYLSLRILTKNVALCMDSVVPSSIQNMEEMSPPAYPDDSSSSSGISLIGHASSETDSETSFQTPKQSFPSSSTSTHSIESYPNNGENEESIPFLSSKEKEGWKTLIIEKSRQRA